MERRKIMTFEALEKNLKNEKYILLYKYPQSSYLYDLFHRLDDGSWTVEIASTSKLCCHNCGNFLTNGKDHDKCKPVIMTEKEILRKIKESMNVFKNTCEVISYKEYNDFVMKYNDILKAFKNRDSSVSFRGKDIKEFMNMALEYLVGSNTIIFKKLISRTIKDYSEYNIADYVYYFIVKERASKNFGFHRDLKKSPKK